MAEYRNTEKVQAIFAKHGGSPTNTGSVEGQIALFTYRINHLTQHLKSNPKDFSTRRSLLKMVGQRKRLLTYLMRKDINQYRTLISELGIRK